MYRCWLYSICTPVASISGVSYVKAFLHNRLLLLSLSLRHPFNACHLDVPSLLAISPTVHACAYVRGVTKSLSWRGDGREGGGVLVCVWLPPLPDLKIGNPQISQAGKHGCNIHNYVEVLKVWRYRIWNYKTNWLYVLICLIGLFVLFLSESHHKKPPPFSPAATHFVPPPLPPPPIAFNRHPLLPYAALS